MLFASMLFFTAMQSRPVMHELLITVAVLLSAPVTAMMLARAAVFRDRRANRPDVPEHPGLAGRAGQRPTGERQE
jgi:multicomponent K+:H+ antiporter subunit G